MQYLYYWIAGGLLVIALAAGIIEGGWMWLATAILLPVAIAIVVADRVAKARRPEDDSSKPMNTSAERP